MSRGWIKLFVLAVVHDKPSSIIWKCPCKIGNTPRTKLSLFSSTTALDCNHIKRYGFDFLCQFVSTDVFFIDKIEARERRQPEKCIIWPLACQLLWPQHFRICRFHLRIVGTVYKGRQKGLNRILIANNAMISLHKFLRFVQDHRRTWLTHFHSIGRIWNRIYRCYSVVYHDNNYYIPYHEDNNSI